MKIADITLKNNVALAPMSGVSDLPFRRASAGLGAGLVVSEMVASEELARARPDVVRRATGDGDVRPFVVQLAGREARWMNRGARLAEEAGADIIDINMGCPSRQVTGQLSGSALMRDLDRAASLIEAVVAGTSRPVTLKMRLGWDRDGLNAPELAARAEQIGARMITVHGRTRCQFFSGAADWSAVRAVKDAVTTPVLVNGDIVDLDTARRALESSGADGVMIGRAALGRPWLTGAIADALEKNAPQMTAPSLERQAAIAIDHYRDTMSFYGERLGKRIARKHLAAYVDHAPVEISAAGRRSFRAAVCQEQRPARVVDMLQAFYFNGRTRPLLHAA